MTVYFLRSTYKTKTYVPSTDYPIEARVCTYKPTNPEMYVQASCFTGWTVRTEQPIETRACTYKPGNVRTSLLFYCMDRTYRTTNRSTYLYVQFRISFTVNVDRGQYVHNNQWKHLHVHYARKSGQEIVDANINLNLIYSSPSQ
jgi:hypothetical protein